MRSRLTVLVTGIFLLTPIFGFSSTVFFGLVDWKEMKEILLQGHLPFIFFLMMIWTLIHFWRYFGGFSDTRPQNLHEHFQKYSRNYWGLFLFYSLLIPGAYLIFRIQSGINVTPHFSTTFFALQLTVSILAGMPVYLYSIDKLSSLVARYGLTKVQSSLKSRILLLSGLIPILCYALLIEYFWLHTGFLSDQTLVIWSALTALTLIISILSVMTLQQSLEPVEQALHGSGAITNRALASIKPQSTDEFGFLTQTLARVFQRLSDQETHMHAIIDNAAEGIIVIDEQGLVDTFNLAAQKLFHFSSHEIRGKPLTWLIPNILTEDGTPVYQEGTVKLKGVTRSGSPLSLALCVSEMNISGRTMYIYIVEDISEREAAMEKLQKAEAMYRDLVETAHDLVWSMDIDGNWSYLNSACVNLYGYDPEEMIGRSVSEFQIDEYRELENKAFQEVLEGKELYQFETIHHDRYGNNIHLSLNARAQRDDAGKIVRITGTAHDITETMEYQKQLSYQAEHDALTGLYNRRFFQQELDRVIARAARNGVSSGLLYVDLDQFKYINDTLGHAAGDRLLIEISKLLARHAREGDLLARFGGDEFTLLLYNVEEKNLQQVAENFRRLMDNYHFLDGGKSFNISCSIGAALINDNTASSEEVMSHADLACNIAKSKGRNCVNLYNPEDRDEDGMAEDMGWAARVRDMLDNDRFLLVYQPIFATASQDIHEYEVLIRMPCDDGQVILPGGFIPAAERFGLIHHLDRWIVHHAILRMSELQAQGIQAGFAINLSGHSYEDESLIPLIKDMINTTGVNPSAITFEISETSAITNLTAATDFINQLKKLGCHSALDDFGSGFCSFSYLKKLPVDKLKIDGSLIRGIANSAVDRAMVQSMNQIGHALGKITIAECVEDEKTLEVLRDLGVDYAQGHYLAEPMSEPFQSNHIKSDLSLGA